MVEKERLEPQARAAGSGGWSGMVVLMSHVARKFLGDRRKEVQRDELPVEVLG